MKRRIIQRRQAERDLVGLARFIRRDNVIAADRLLEAFDQTIQSILQQPELGNSWETTNPRYADLRWRPIQGFPNHLIFYRILDDRVVVLRVVYGTRDLQASVKQDVDTDRSVHGISGGECG